MSDSPSYHCVISGGILIQVDADTRKEIESWMNSLEYPKDHFACIVVNSIHGEDVTIYADSINNIYSTNSEQRRRARELGRSIEEEGKAQGFYDE